MLIDSVTNNTKDSFNHRPIIVSINAHCVYVSLITSINICYADVPLIASVNAHCIYIMDVDGHYHVLILCRLNVVDVIHTLKALFMFLLGINFFRILF